MLQRYVVIAAAWLEIIVGAILIAVPGLPCVLLFATRPEGITVPVARFAGVGLLALGISCLPSMDTASRRGVVGLCVFNVGVTILLASVAIATTFRGVLLWPVVILHAVLATALVSQLLTTRS